MSFILDTLLISEGDVIDGGQPGNITLGSSDSNITLISGGVSQLEAQPDGTIQLGNSVSDNSIFLNGGVDFLLRKIVDPAFTPPNFTLTVNDFMIDVISDTFSTVTLPLSGNSGGRMYIVSRGFSGAGVLTLVTSGVDTIDGDPSISLPVQDTRVKVISDGVSKWYVI
jgi:hypothetical protein